MPEARWTNQSQPQTLQVAVFLLYANAAFFVIDMLRARISLIDVATALPWGTLLVASMVGAVLAGRGIASERRWGYLLGLAVSLSPFVLRLLASRSVSGLVQVDYISLMFEVALVALLLHEQSRQYQRIWFK